MMWYFDLEFRFWFRFLTFSYFWAFTLVSINSFMTGPLSYRNLSIDLQSNWFLYDNGLRLERVKKIVGFTFLRYFNLKVEYKGVISMFLFLLVWSWSTPYLTILALPPPFSKFPDPPLALFLKRNHPKKYQVSKRFFIRNKFL